ncbi:hypothetical protein M427DRAFT_50427 [Gonapodya prolifera JEL478]|uniref:Mis12-domain-containing protein n=1 Tax=Gonapodya prolifera (strain JEL478) TaxID=1344416 RepID=A0A139B027_GONPJ|nr:hypothetical protein M427DRAFT_50427 [Gonapodya prolifera JEL478]|eukprot:KXS22065.1 hypothetical protein M427DRAFT_50427 [Gonapodya prolifera JEL478]
MDSSAGVNLANPPLPELHQSETPAPMSNPTAINLLSHDSGASDPKVPVKAHPVVVKHLGFFPLDFVDDVVDAFNSVMYQGVDKLRDYVEEQYVWPDSDLEVENGMASIETLLEHAHDVHTDKFEMMSLNNAFRVPEELPIRLPYEKNLDYAVSESDALALDEELEQLRKEVAAETLLNARLRAHDARLASRLSIRAPDAVQQERIAEHAQTRPPLSKLASQLTQLTRVVQSTRPILSTPFRTLPPTYLDSAVARQAARARKAVGADIDGDVVAGKVVRAERERTEAWAVGGLGEVKDFWKEVVTTKSPDAMRVDADDKENIAQ